MGSCHGKPTQRNQNGLKTFNSGKMANTDKCETRKQDKKRK